MKSIFSKTAYVVSLFFIISNVQALESIKEIRFIEAHYPRLAYLPNKFRTANFIAGYLKTEAALLFKDYMCAGIIDNDRLEGLNQDLDEAKKIIDEADTLTLTEQEIKTLKEAIELTTLLINNIHSK
jgi:hypothetical protein